MDELRELIDQIEQFLQSQVERMEQFMVSDEGSRSQELRLLCQEFQEERERWELERQETLTRLRQEGDLLTSAWQQLEDERRRLLAERELLRRRSSVAVESGRAASATELAPSPGSNRKNDSLAWMQFQRLRRESFEHGKG